MKIIVKLFVSIVVALVLAVLVIAGIAPSDYNVKKEVTINKNSKRVFAYIKLLKNQEDYSAWAKMDPQMKREYKGTDGTKGFVVAWQSANKQVGRGEQEITDIVDGRRIDTELRFFEPFESVNSAYMVTEKLAPGKTKVVWGFDGKMPYPFNVFLLFMDMDKEIGSNLQQGLLDLKNILEKS